MNKAGAHISAGDRRSAVKRKSMTYDINSSRGGGGSSNNNSSREQAHVVREERNTDRERGCKGVRKRRQAGKAERQGGKQGRHFVVLKRWKMLALSALPNRDTYTHTHASTHTLTQHKGSALKSGVAAPAKQKLKPKKQRRHTHRHKILICFMLACSLSFSRTLFPYLSLFVLPLSS